MRGSAFGCPCCCCGCSLALIMGGLVTLVAALAIAPLFGLSLPL